MEFDENDIDGMIFGNIYCRRIPQLDEIERALSVMIDGFEKQSKKPVNKQTSEYYKGLLDGSKSALYLYSQIKNMDKGGGK